MPLPSFEDRIAAVRRFNRFHTRHVGALNEGLLDSAFSIAEARVLYELAHRERPSAAELGRALGLDPGYLSRLLRGLRERGLVASEAAVEDARRNILSLTEAGRAVYEPLERASRDEVAGILETLPETDQVRLLAAMETIERLLGDRTTAPPAYLLRPHRIGDLGWVVHRHGVLYAEEYGWDETFEGMVAGIVADFLRDLDPRRECCWIAEVEGAIAGSAFVVAASETEAKLRLVYVEPDARGLGIGRRLVEECMAFARRAGYTTMSLWTNDVLVAARRVYEALGFELEREERHESFGKDLVGQYWITRL